MVALFRCRPTVRCRVRLLSWLVPPCADRELAARSDAYRKTTAHGQLRVRVRSEQIAAAGVERVPKVELLGAGASYAQPYCFQERSDLLSPLQPGAGSDTEGRTQAEGNACWTRPSHACRSFSGESRRRVGSARGASACRSASSITWLNVRPLRAALIFACTTPAGACPVTSKSELKRRSAAARRARLALTRCVTTVAGRCRHRACIQ